MPDVIKILIADDHAIFRDGLRRLLAEESDLQVIGEASDGVEAVRSEPIHLRCEVRRTHEQLGERRTGRRCRDHVVHQDRHGPVVRPGGGCSRAGCKEKANDGEDRRRLR